MVRRHILWLVAVAATMGCPRLERVSEGPDTPSLDAPSLDDTRVDAFGLADARVDAWSFDTPTGTSTDSGTDATRVDTGRDAHAALACDEDCVPGEVCASDPPMCLPPCPRDFDVAYTCIGVRTGCAAGSIQFSYAGPRGADCYGLEGGGASFPTPSALGECPPGLIDHFVRTSGTGVVRLCLPRCDATCATGWMCVLDVCLPVDRFFERRST